MEPNAITYEESTDTIFVDYFDFDKEAATVFINLYDGYLIKTVKKEDDFNFFRFVLNGHRSIWLLTDIWLPIVE